MIRCATLVLLSVLICCSALACSSAEEPQTAPEPRQPETSQAPDTKPGPKGDATPSVANDASTDSNESTGESGLSDETKALSDEQKTLIAITTADIDCAKKRRPASEVTALLNGRLQQHRWSESSYRTWSNELLEHDAAARTAYDNRMKACPPETVSTDTRAKVELVYVELMCIAKKGLNHKDWARRAANTYKKHGLPAQEYTTAMRTLITDQAYQKELAQKVNVACPGPMKSPEPVKKAPKLNGTFKGRGTGLRGFSVELLVKFEKGAVKNAIAKVGDANWPLKGTVKDKKLSLAGKRGNDSIVFRGAIKSNVLLGNFSGFVGGAKQQGSWTATKK